MNKNNYAVIMAGGIGSRFWPMSTVKTPKQFIDILGTGETLIQQTFNRLRKICPIDNIFIVTNKNYKSLCIEQLSEIKTNNILCEPVMRNTAPCLAYAAFKIFSLNENAKMIVAPSDHLITKEEEFVKIVNESLNAIEKTNSLLTLGIKPNRPDTGYGYIQFNDENLSFNNKIKKVKTFTEKPNQELALQFIDSGDFSWNSGIFIWKVKDILLSIRKYLRDIYDIFETGHNYFNTEKEEDFIEQNFPLCKNISIDYGIMEKADNVYVYNCNFGWSDLGTWGSLYNHIKKDQNENVLVGSNVKLYNCTGNIVNLSDKKNVILEGLENFIIVEKDNTLLICKKDSEQKIKDFVSNLNK